MYVAVAAGGTCLAERSARVVLVGARDFHGGGHAVSEHLAVACARVRLQRHIVASPVQVAAVDTHARGARDAAEDGVDAGAHAADSVRVRHHDAHGAVRRCQHACGGELPCELCSWRARGEAAERDDTHGVGRVVCVGVCDGVVPGQHVAELRRQTVYAHRTADARRGHGAVASAGVRAGVVVDDGLQRDPPRAQVQVGGVDVDGALNGADQRDLALGDLGDGAQVHELDLEASVVHEVGEACTCGAATQARGTHMERVAGGVPHETVGVFGDADVCVDLVGVRGDAEGRCLHMHRPGGGSEQLRFHQTGARGRLEGVLQREVQLSVVHVRAVDVEDLHRVAD
eukprot:PhM_4_TR17375/c0_g2_i1/m.73152